jgi:hypothetical protein
MCSGPSSSPALSLSNLKYPRCIFVVEFHEWPSSFEEEENVYEETLSDKAAHHYQIAAADKAGRTAKTDDIVLTAV